MGRRRKLVRPNPMAMEGGTFKAVRAGKSAWALTLRTESGVVRLISAEDALQQWESRPLPAKGPPQATWKRSKRSKARNATTAWKAEWKHKAGIKREVGRTLRGASAGRERQKSISARVRCKQPMTPRSPNGGTRLTYNQSLRSEHIGAVEQTQSELGDPVLPFFWGEYWVCRFSFISDSPLLLTEWGSFLMPWFNILFSHLPFGARRG
jgi:hypothetical protein